MSEFVSETAKKAGDRDLTKFEVMQIHAEYRQWSDKEITALRQQLEQAEAKVDLFRRACEDLLDDRPIERAFILRKQAEAVEKFGQEIGVFDPEYDDQEYVEIPRREVKAYTQRLRQQADEAELAGGER